MKFRQRFLLVLLVASCLVAACGGGGGDGVKVLGYRGPLTSYKGIDLADMDADGLNDIVSAGYTGDGNGQKTWYVAVFLQRATSPGTFASPETFDYASNGAVPREIEVADLQAVTGKPALNSNLCLAWACLRAAEIPFNERSPTESYPLLGGWSEAVSSL